MDLFNRKKVKELENKLLKIQEAFEMSQGELNAYKNVNNIAIDNKKLLEENEKLIHWIMNILDTFGTMEVRDRRTFSIPIYKNNIHMDYDNYHNYDDAIERESIIIPQIRIIKYSQGVKYI